LLALAAQGLENIKKEVPPQILYNGS